MSIPHPHAWWVKVRDVPGAPASFELRRDGGLWAKRVEWAGNGRDRCTLERVAVRMTDEKMRAAGFERCFCDPAEHGRAADDCPAHTLAGI